MRCGRWSNPGDRTPRGGNGNTDHRRRFEITPAAKNSCVSTTPRGSSPRPSIGNRADCARRGGSLPRHTPSFPRRCRCPVGDGAFVDGAPGVFGAGGRAVSRPPPVRTLQGRAANVGGARLRHGTSGTFPPAMTPHPPTFTGGDVARGAECGAARGPPLRGLLTGVGMAENRFSLLRSRLFFPSRRWSEKIQVGSLVASPSDNRPRLDVTNRPTRIIHGRNTKPWRKQGPALNLHRMRRTFARHETTGLEYWNKRTRKKWLHTIANRVP